MAPARSPSVLPEAVASPIERGLLEAKLAARIRAAGHAGSSAEARRHRPAARIAEAHRCRGGWHGVAGEPRPAGLPAHRAGREGARRAFGTVGPSLDPFSVFDLRFQGSWLAITVAVGSCTALLTAFSFLPGVPDLFTTGGGPVLAGEVGLFLMGYLILLEASVLLLLRDLVQRARLAAKSAPDRLS